MTLITPILCYQGIHYLYLVRVVEGLFGGLSFPSSKYLTRLTVSYKMKTFFLVNTVWSKWSPPLERSRISGFGMSGCFSGTVVAMLLSGFLAVNFGWESIFYVFGVAGVVWSVVWLIVVKESPEDDKKMSEKEKNFIKKSLERRGQVNVVKPPWKSIFTSKPVSSRF
jgi:MFS transporter, ACS family, solute carrier family 17 (sodium-dependent inorganic phosphate cotransporter), other